VATNNQAIQEAVARARARMAEQKEAADKKAGKHLLLNVVKSEPTQRAAALPLDSHPAIPALYELPAVGSTHALRWNPEQLNAIKYGMDRKSFCLIGAAGTGKTTTLKGLLKELMESNRCPPLEAGTKHLSAASPGIALVSYTRRAVRNIAKQMPADLKPHCLTIHKLIEFEPEIYEKEMFDDNGISIGMKNTMRFAPQRTRFNPLPRNLTTLVIDEASMVSIELFQLLLEALPNPRNVQFIILGDLNQLPPVYGQAILGNMLLEKPIIELTQVYRQALESPIISLALAIKNENFKSFNDDCNNGTFKVTGGNGTPIDARKIEKAKITIEREGRGKVTLHPWKTKWEQEDALNAIKGQINAWISSGEYLPDEDLILCPWNQSFGTDELNKSIANKLGRMRNADVYEIIAGYNKYYFAVGDKLVIDKQEALIIKIERNPKYAGKRPGPHSPFLDRWGCYQKAVKAEDDDLDMSDADIDALLESMTIADERTTEASHIIRVKMLDSDEEIGISKSAIINGSSFGYAITVHKAQGSECRKVFFLTHYCHSAMLMRELVYTAITRAAEELYIVMSPEMLHTAAKRPRIKGNTLAAKLAWYQSKMDERMAS
jgi:ATP-dependent exoDNAse (exonuclease V) alpha subunit